MLPFIFELCEKNKIPATFFEITTALAFMKFGKSNCDAVVLEVGLGGEIANDL
jgi:dihydrofolate synthase/folylpolyglutamate synthase